jgi:hypothetical protein
LKGNVERHVRRPAPLALVSPFMVADVVGGIAPPLGLTKFGKQPICASSE